MTTSFFRQFARRGIVRNHRRREPVAETEYKYTPLESREYIRIIHLFPAEERNADIRCAITVHSRATVPSYEAISYVKGEQIFDQNLKSTDGNLKITASLAHALRHFRLPNQDRRLWVDTISINQLDHEEKIHQISSMDETFKKAIKVFSWLGEDSEDSIAIVIGGGIPRFAHGPML